MKVIINLLNLITGIFVITSQKLMKNVRLYTLIQVATESYKSEQKTAKTKTETTTLLNGKVISYQIKDLRSI